MGGAEGVAEGVAEIRSRLSILPASRPFVIGVAPLALAAEATVAEGAQTFGHGVASGSWYSPASPHHGQLPVSPHHSRAVAWRISLAGAGPISSVSRACWSR